MELLSLEGSGDGIKRLSRRTTPFPHAKHVAARAYAEGVRRKALLLHMDKHGARDSVANASPPHALFLLGRESIVRLRLRNPQYGNS